MLSVNKHIGQRIVAEFSVWHYVSLLFTNYLQVCAD